MGLVMLSEMGLEKDFLESNPGWMENLEENWNFEWPENAPATRLGRLLHRYSSKEVGLKGPLDGYKCMSQRGSNKIAVTDLQGNPRYGGWHDRMEGMYWNFPSLEGKMLGVFNPSLSSLPLIAFRDGNDVRVQSEKGPLLCNRDVSEELKVHIFGGPFEEVYPTDMVVGYYSIGGGVGKPMVTYPPNLVMRPATVLRFMLGKQDGEWKLKDLTGKTYVSSPDREVMKNIVGCVPGAGTELNFFSLGKISPESYR